METLTVILTGVGSAWKIAKVHPKSTVAVFGLGTIGLAVSFHLSNFFINLVSILALHRLFFKPRVLDFAYFNKVHLLCEVLHNLLLILTILDTMFL
jgi:hypothetical protein